jgi:RNA-directed DNA polymerase
LTEVCSPQRKLIPDTEDWERHELTSLRGIAYKAKTKPDDRFRDLSRCIDETLLGYCFGKLNKKAATGVDRVSYGSYKENYVANIEDLISRLKRRGYRAKLVKRKHIPKGAGKTRPLGIPVLEDKLLQTAASEILSAIYDHDKLLEMLARRIDDKRFLRLINKWLKAGILEEDKSIFNQD